MKVLHIITGLGVGGAELQLRSVLRHTRHDAEVLTLYNPGPVADMIREDGGRVRDLAMTSNTQLSALPRLRRMIRQGRYDVVHTHLYRAQVYGQPAARLAGVRAVVTTEHSIGDTHIERRELTHGIRALYLAGNRLCDATISVSDVVTERLVGFGVPARRITMIPNGLDLGRVEFDADARAKVRAEFGITPETFVIGLLGRFDPIKQYDVVIRAAAPLLGPNRKLLIVGDGAERPVLERAARESGVTTEVLFAGERHDVAAFLSAFDLFISSSTQETFGLSVLEALANGLPVLYTTCPALAGVTTDRAREVRGGIDSFRAEIGREMERGVQAREPVTSVTERYGVESTTARIDDLYDAVVRRRSVRRA